MNHKLAFILIAPNLSEQSAGEPIKALHIFRQILSRYPDTIQITHSRFKRELESYPEHSSIRYVEDDLLFIAMWRSVVLRFAIDARFSRLARRLVDDIVATQRWHDRTVVVWHTLPNSPPQFRSIARARFNVIGPVNGNIYWPDVFRHDEPSYARLRRRLHLPAQRLNRLLRLGCRRADLILSAGGDRTTQSLLAGGCSIDRIVPSLDYGLSESLFSTDRIRHIGANRRFVHFGRLVQHKGTDLAIEAIAHSGGKAELDIIGRGPELPRLRALAARLGVESRVRFIDWFASRDALFSALRSYRGMVLPSFEDANGIVVQEALAIGLPPICLDWGGPQLLISAGKTGYLIGVESRSGIIRGISEAMQCLAEDGGHADALSAAGRSVASKWVWRDVIDDWITTIGKRIDASAQSRN